MFNEQYFEFLHTSAENLPDARELTTFTLRQRGLIRISKEEVLYRLYLDYQGKNTFRTGQESKRFPFFRRTFGGPKGPLLSIIQSVCKYVSQVGARLSAFHMKWICITQDQSVLETLREGLKLEFITQPVLKIKETSVLRYGIHESIILTEINTLL